MAFNMHVKIELKGTLQGRNVNTEFAYFRETANNAATSQAVVDAFYTTQWAALKDLLTNRYRLMEIRGEVLQIPPTMSKPTYIRFVDEAGTITDSESMPAFNSVNVFKVPDNTTKDPVEAQDFEIGWNGYAGFPENVTNNGILINAAVPDWNAFGEALEELTFDISGTPTVAVLGMYRPVFAGTPPVQIRTDKVLVSETYAGQKIGSRLSRKMR